jgi:hypothetical protein
VDYDETFSPVIKPAIIRSVLSIIISRTWPIHQLDIKNAFLHCHLDETVYCQQPPGFIDPSAPDSMCLLHKSLYCLKQAPCLVPPVCLISHYYGFHTFSLGCFSICLQEWLSIGLPPVDDIILTASSSELLHSITSRLCAEFAMTDLGDLSYFLGIFVTRSADGLHLSQQQYAVDWHVWPNVMLPQHQLTLEQSYPLLMALWFLIHLPTEVLSVLCSTLPSPDRTFHMLSNRSACTCTHHGNPILLSSRGYFSISRVP